MALDYTTAKSTLNEIATRYSRAAARLEKARTELSLAETELNDMQADYSSFATELDTKASTEGTAIWIDAKAEKDVMVSDFQALKTRATDLITAYDSV